jgi:hypothetical protein
MFHVKQGATMEIPQDLLKEIPSHMIEGFSFLQMMKVRQIANWCWCEGFQDRLEMEREELKKEMVQR